MRKKALLEQINSQKKQMDEQKKMIDNQKQQLDVQCKTAENIMEIFKILTEGGDISVHIYSNKEPSYFVTPKGSNKTELELCTRKIFEGLYARGLLVVISESVHEDFASQRYGLRVLQKKSQ